MGLSDIAAGLEVTHEQRERGVATADDTGAQLAERIEPFEEALPCGSTTVAAVIEVYAEGASVERAAAVVGIPTTTAAKALYRLGEPIEPLSPTARDIIDDWLAGELSRTEARTLAGVGDREFALGAYVATHEPIEGAEAAIADALSIGAFDDPLSDARGDPDEWL